MALTYELAAVAKRIDGQRAAFFPRPDGHQVPVVSCVVSDRAWIAEALGHTPDSLLAAFDDATRNPVAWREVADAPVQAVVHHPPLDVREQARRYANLFFHRFQIPVKSIEEPRLSKPRYRFQSLGELLSGAYPEVEFVRRGLLPLRDGTQLMPEEPS